MSSKGYNLHSLQKRILVLFLLISFVFISLFVRLFWVQVISSENLQKLAEDQWTRSLPIVAERGKITDKNGTELAYSVTKYSVYTRAREIKKPVETANILADILGYKFSSIIDKVSDRGFSEILIASKIDTESAVKIYKKQLDGVYITENSERQYLYGDLLTQVLGFTTTDNVGQAGIEQYYNSYLQGENGFVMKQSDLTGVKIKNSLDTFIPAKPGFNIKLTIDINLQKIVEKVIEQLMVEQNAKSASCIMMKSKTGEILAMTTKPSFDLNNIPREDIDLLMQTVKNQAVVDIYEPGSTFKIITMAIALETGVAKLSDRFYCSGSCVVDGEKIKCWKSIGHGSQTLAEGLANSCNCVFTALAQRIGLEKFYEYLYKFGYGTQTGISISGESKGIIMNKDLVKVVDLARMGFGQAVAVTLLQQICGVSCAVNGGNLVTPYIVKNITNDNDKVILENSPKIIRNIISAKTSKIINDMLDLTVSKQTGKYSFVKGYAVGGKTGTTQKYENGKISGQYISSFVGTYPVNDPEYTIIISVDEPKAGAYYGSIVASPYAKLIFKEMFDMYNILPDDPNLIGGKPQKVEMPNLMNLSLTKAIKIIKDLNLNYEISGNGKTVVKQLPMPKVLIEENSTILIELSE